jgi:hypothetical protein
MIDGHIGLKNEKREEIASGEFQTALSYLTLDERRAVFVIHVYSTTFDYSPYLQRSDIRNNGRPNFLERLGFEKCRSCNILAGHECYYKVIEEVDRAGGRLAGGFESHQRIQAIYDRYRRFANGLKDIFDKMASIDQSLYNSGFELPWDGLKLSPIVYGQEEKAYPPGFQYDFYKDILDIMKKATSEVMIIEPYPSDDLLNLYLEKVDPKTQIKILIGAPRNQSSAPQASRDSFIKVAQKFAQRPGVKFEVRENASAHDRLIFVDSVCWVTGQSVKDAAVQKPTYLLRVESSDLFGSVFNPLWNAGKKVI